MAYILLQDEHTGQPLSAGAVATRFVLQNNGDSNDRMATSIASSVPHGSSYEQALRFLSTRLTAFQHDGNSEGERATLDAMTYFQLREQVQHALSAGQTQIEADLVMLRATAMNDAHALVVQQAQTAAQQERDQRAQAETLRLNSRTALQAALDEKVGPLPEYQDRVLAVLQPLIDAHITRAAARTRLLNMQSGAGLVGESWDNAMALEVFDRQIEIAHERRAAHAQQVAATAAPAAAPQAPAAAPANNSAALSPIQLQGDNFNPAAQALLELAPTPRMKNRAQILIRAAAGYEGGDEATGEAMIRRLRTGYEVHQNDPALRDDYIRAIGIVHRTQRLQSLHDQHVEQTDPIDWRDEAHYSATLTQSMQYANGLFRGDTQLAEANSPDRDPAPAGGGHTGGGHHGRGHGGGSHSGGEVQVAQWTPTQRAAIIARHHYEAIEPSVQLALERLGHSTGGRNHRLFGGGAEADRLDGMSGPATQAAIRAIQQANNLPVTGHLDTATTARITELANALTPDAIQQAQQQALAQSPARQSAPRTPATDTRTAGNGAQPAADPRQELASELATAQTKSPDAIHYMQSTEAQAALVLPAMLGGKTEAELMEIIRQRAVAKLNTLPLNAQDRASLAATVHILPDGVVHSDELANIETHLGLPADGNFDEQVGSLLSNHHAAEVIAQIFRSSTVSGGSAVVSNDAPAGTPQTGAGAQRNG